MEEPLLEEILKLLEEKEEPLSKSDIMRHLNLKKEKPLEEALEQLIHLHKIDSHTFPQPKLTVYWSPKRVELVLQVQIMFTMKIDIANHSKKIPSKAGHFAVIVQFFLNTF